MCVEFGKSANLRLYKIPLPHTSSKQELPSQHRRIDLHTNDPLTCMPRRTLDSLLVLKCSESDSPDHDLGRLFLCLDRPADLGVDAV